jgi:hypothetical protein
MDTPETRAEGAGAETPGSPATKIEKKDGSITFTVVMMLLALACVGITAAIAFHDMMAP